jgi:two-component system, OmpR family, phosphate regulon response regulator PhoB
MTIRCHGLEIDKSRHRLVVDGQVCLLSPIEMKILIVLAEQPGAFFTSAHIVAALHSGESVTERAVDAQMKSLRNKLGAKAAHLIETVRGVGYRLAEPP